ncbi:glutathione S-transferase [Parerythrobacter lacustris]|uniref:Glutathione S-transferase n=1 Tax=Parerythrobacter lacustris TaxID=2969984 RepID=A0ABT1XRT6_9SPHN|nr:glutathione S-transferase [Parerythrobacter lacustris]MCR2833385.1 glutathione S-transferase [Parerythrobacter lacustris]
MTDLPILYSFRRCPYAMRARMALWISGTACELREVKLGDKPPAMLEASPKGTVPVLLLPDGEVIDESIAIMRWALARNDPEDWLAGDHAGLIDLADGPFKHHLDRYKYPSRYADEPDNVRTDHRGEGLAILSDLNFRLVEREHLLGERRTMADIALFPFIRQFANADRDWFDAQPIPHLQAWLERHLESALFAAVMSKFVPWKSGDAPVIFAP